MKHFYLPNFFALLFVAALVSTTACDKEPEPEPEFDPFENFTPIANEESGEYMLTLFGEKEAFSGFNWLYFKLNKGDETIENVDFSLSPLMDMSTHKHACPFENPELNDDGVYQGAVVFQMPSMMGSWTLGVTADVQKGEPLNFNFDIHVKNPEFARVHVITSPVDDSRLVVAYNEPPAHRVGNNAFDITIHKMDNMMTFTPQDGYSVEITPEMPSMGHGSLGNVHPSYQGSGHYVGNVNFNMTGDWRIHLKVEKEGNTVRDDLYYDLFFQ